jgi:hypothetical protein
MINTMPTIITVMTAFPQTINGKDSITRAEQLMQKKRNSSFTRCYRRYCREYRF